MTSLDQPGLLRNPPVIQAFSGAAASSTLASAEGISVQIHRDPAAVEADWRHLESEGDGTVFQSFGWCTAWMRHIGTRADVQPVIVVGRGRAGDVLFLLPLAIQRSHGLRRLSWLAADLCDYNGPLLARSFTGAIGTAGFPAVWRAICRSIAEQPDLRFDVVALDKMLETIGTQPNPFLTLSVLPNPSGAYATRLEADWERFYGNKRSASTRRRDRTKLKKLGAMGTVAFVTPAQESETAAVLDVLFTQKHQSFARMGVADVFARPGYQAFFRDLATDPSTRDMTHVSRLDVGPTLAAANFGLLAGGRYYHILASYDGGPVSRFGPGAAHLRELMRYAIEHGCTVFDFTIGDEPYKRDWADTELVLHDHHAAGTLRGLGAVLLFVGYRRLKRHIKRTPALWAAYTKARAVLGGRVMRTSGDSPSTGAEDGDES